MSDLTDIDKLRIAIGEALMDAGAPYNEAASTASAIVNKHCEKAPVLAIGPVVVNGQCEMTVKQWDNFLNHVPQPVTRDRIINGDQSASIRTTQDIGDL